jgi:hypothetical protein
MYDWMAAKGLVAAKTGGRLIRLITGQTPLSE